MISRAGLRTMSDKAVRLCFRVFSPRRVLAASAGVLFIIGAWIVVTTEVSPARLALDPCRMVYDRHGELLRFIPDNDGLRHTGVESEAIPDHVKNAFVAVEDERFTSHPGFDIAAILRALGSNIREGRIVSGASTITQQLARLAYPRERTYFQKILEVVRAFRIELLLSKEEILAAYLNRVPLGNNLRGVEAASMVYFGKPARDLTVAEGAVLASLPRAPGLLNPYGPRRSRLVERAGQALARMEECGTLEDGSAARASLKGLSFAPKRFPMKAAHFVDHLAASLPPGETRTTLDYSLQERVEEIIASHRVRLEYKGASQAAAVVVDNRSMDLIAMAGSIEYSPREQGYNNGAAALRSPGSALKPFLYARALELGYTAASVLEDTEAKYRSPAGDYVPVNFNRRTYGPVSMREGLSNSLNLSAVYMLNQVGLEPFYETLDRLGLINHRDRGPGHYGLGMVVGNPEVTMLQLARAYAALANGGLLKEVRMLSTDLRDSGVRAFSPEAAYIVTDILQDPAARTITFGHSLAMDFPFPLAVKTGTSTRHRDCWVVGYTPDYTVAVWTGNFSGMPTWGLSGSTGSAPILADVFRALHPMGPPSGYTVPEAVRKVRVCTHSGEKPIGNCPSTKLELFVAGTEPDEECGFHRNSDLQHQLPGAFAGWVAGRIRSGEQGRYTVSGAGNSLAGLRDHDLPKGNRDIPVIKGTVTLEGGPWDSAAGGADGSVRIVYPFAGDRYVTDRFDDGQFIVLKAVSHNPGGRVSWFVDGEPHQVTAAPYETRWSLKRGTHLIAAVGPDGKGDSVSVLVE